MSDAAQAVRAATAGSLAALDAESLGDLIRASLGPEADSGLWDALTDPTVISRTKAILGALDADLLSQVSRPTPTWTRHAPAAWHLATRAARSSPTRRRAGRLAPPHGRVPAPGPAPQGIREGACRDPRRRIRHGVAEPGNAAPL